MKKKYDNTQDAKHSKLTEKQVLKNNIKYILGAIALLIAIIMLLFAESKLIITNKPTGEDVSVKFNQLYYLNEETEERFLTLSDAIAKAVQDDPTEKSTIKVINNKTETSVVTIPAGKEIELDLNGKIVAFNIDPESADESGITNYGDLTITDSTDVVDATNVIDYTMADGSKPHVAGTITSNKRTVTNKVTVTNNEIIGRGNLVISGTAHINGTGDSDYTIVNDGTMTVDGGTITSDVFGTICNGENAVSAKTTVNGGTIISQRMGIYNLGNNNQENNPAVLITGGKIEAQSNAIINFDTSTGLIYIVGGDIKGGLNNAYNPTIYNGGNGKIIIDEEHAGDTVITDYSRNCAVYNGYVADSTGTIEIRGGNITARNAFGITSLKNSTLIIGTDEVAAGGTTSVSTTVPSIKGDTGGIYCSNTATLNFYDGQITGPTNESLNRAPNTVPQYFAKVVINNDNGTETAILKRSIEYAQVKDIEIYDIDKTQIELTTTEDMESVASYTSNDTGVVTVNSTGEVTGVSAGTTTITITGQSGRTKTVNVKVKPTYNSSKSVNAPKLTNGMIPIKWNGSTWVVCSEDDSDWYTYGNTAATQQWANVMLSDGTYKASTYIPAEGETVQTATVGQKIAESELGSMYTWIPRYSYKMPENATTTKGTIDITYLKKNSNEGTDGVVYQKAASNTDTETTKVVHPAFTLGTKELTGFWVAKFEMSGKRSDTTVTNGVVSNAVGNATASGNNGAYDPADYEPGVTIAKSLPNFPSWRNITIGESEYQSMLIASDNKAKYGIGDDSNNITTADSASSHLIKNSEWGAVAYLCYSNYGTVPQINGCGSLVTNNSSWYYDMYTGQGPVSSGSTSRYNFDPASTIADRGYSTTKGMLASTTGNITGVYDMNGGSWERVAAYLDNGNGNLNSYGKSTSNSSVTYFNCGALLSAYTDLWDAYEVSSEEKTNEISINGGASTVTQSQLWQNAKTEETYIEARKRLTDATYSNMAKHKGIGVNEVSTECSFYTTFDYKSKIAGTDPVEYETKNTWNWFKSVATAISRANGTSTAAEYATSWDDDFVLIGHASYPFVIRGGSCNNGAGAGVFPTNITNGNASYAYGFRAVLIADDGYEAPAKSNETTLRMASENLLYGLDDCGETEGSNARLKYSISNKVITAINTGIHNDGYVATSGRVYLEAGRNYRFECNTNGSSWRTDGGTDIGSVGVSLISNSNSSDSAIMESANCSFTAPATGSYYLRISVYGKNQTATFSNMTITYDDENNLQNNTAYDTLPTPTISGYTFGGWYANAMKTTTLIDNYKVDGTTGNITADNDYITSGLINVQGGTVLYTNMIISGIYSYDINGNLIGKSSDKTSTHLLPEKAKYIRVEIAKSGGNTVSYYNDNLILSDYQDASGVAYINSEVTSATVNAIGKEHTLFAKMVASEYNVTFDKNAADATGTMENQTMNYDIATNLSANTFTRSNYAFAGWNTEADGSGTSYTDGESVTNIASTSVRSVVLYAQWTYNATPTINVEDYNTFTYSAGGGAAYYVSTTQTTAPAAGTTAAQNTFALDTWTTATNTGDLTVEAGKTYYIWVKNAITGGNVSENNATIDVRTITRSVGTGTSLTAKYTNSSGTDITFSNDKADVLNGTVVYMSAGANIGYESAVLKIDGTNVTNSTTYTISGDTTFMTSATEKTATLTYRANGHGTAPANVTMKYSEATNAAAALTATGCVFKGWNTAADGSGTVYAAGQEVKAANTLPSAMTLYAQWEVVPTKYAVQIYGINQDVDASGNTLGLTFGPATGDNYNNKYVTHKYEETSNGSGEYYVKIVTHTVAADGSETTAEDYLYKKGGTTDKVTRTTEYKNKYDINIHSMTWAEIKNKSSTDPTVFTDCMLCGDTKSVSLKSQSVYNQYGDGAGVLVSTIYKDYRRWNPSQSDNYYVGTGVTLDSKEKRDGSNARNAGGYSVSHIRATLIGKNGKTNNGYAGNSNLGEKNCIYSWIESDLQAVITPKKIKYVTGTSARDFSLNDDIADSIWLFSEREMYGTASDSGGSTEGLGASGDGYNKFGNTESKYYISSYGSSATTNRTAYNEAGNTDLWWLRTPSIGYTTGVCTMNNSGWINGNIPSRDYGLAFGFCIQ